MKTLDEIRAPFTDEDGTVPMERIGEMTAALKEELESSKIALQQVTYQEHLGIMEAHFAQMVVFLLQQMASIYAELQVFAGVMNAQIAGDSSLVAIPDPEVLAQEFVVDAMLAVNFDRLARLHEVVLEKSTPKLMVPR